MKVINDLFDYENFKIVQEDQYFKFSLDSILLAEFVDVRNADDQILELCAGNGAVSLILSYYFSNKITAVEIQEAIYELGKESIRVNKKEDQISFIQKDIKNLKNYFPGNNFDIVIANPPYFKYSDQSFLNKNKIKSIARHEIFLKLEELFKVVSYILKENGCFYLVHIPERLEEILSLCQKYKIIAKKIQFIYTNPNKNANMVLIKCVKGANNALKVLPPLYIHNYKSYKNIFKGRSI